MSDLPSSISASSSGGSSGSESAVKVLETTSSDSNEEEEEEEFEDEEVEGSAAVDDDVEEEEEEEDEEEEAQESVAGSRNSDAVVEILDTTSEEEEDAPPASKKTFDPTEKPGAAPAPPRSLVQHTPQVPSFSFGPIASKPMSHTSFGFGPSATAVAEVPLVPELSSAFQAPNTAPLGDDMYADFDAPAPVATSSSHDEPTRVRQSEDLMMSSMSAAPGSALSPAPKSKPNTLDEDAFLDMWGDKAAPVTTSTSATVGQKRGRDLLLDAEEQREVKARRLEPHTAGSDGIRQPMRTVVPTVNAEMNTLPELLCSRLNPDLLAAFLTQGSAPSSSHLSTQTEFIDQVMSALASLSQGLKVDLAPADDEGTAAESGARDAAAAERRKNASAATAASIATFNGETLQQKNALQSEVDDLKQELRRAKNLSVTATADRDFSVKQLAEEKVAHQREISHLRVVRQQARGVGTESRTATRAPAHELEEGRYSSICDPVTPGGTTTPQQRPQQSTFIPMEDAVEEDESTAAASEEGEAATGSREKRDTSALDHYFSDDNKKNKKIVDALLPLHDEVLAIAAMEGVPYDAKTMTPESGSGSHARQVFQKVYSELRRARGLVREHRQQQSRDWKQRYSGHQETTTSLDTGSGAAISSGFVIPPPQPVIFESLELQSVVKSLEQEKKALAMKLAAEEAKVADLTRRAAAAAVKIGGGGGQALPVSAAMALGTLQEPMVKAQVCEVLFGVVSVEPLLDTRSSSGQNTEVIDVKIILSTGKSLTASCPIPVKSVIQGLSTQTNTVQQATVTSSEGLNGFGVGLSVRDLMATLYAPAPIPTTATATVVEGAPAAAAVEPPCKTPLEDLTMAGTIPTPLDPSLIGGEVDQPLTAVEPVGNIDGATPWGEEEEEETSPAEGNAKEVDAAPEEVPMEEDDMPLSKAATSEPEETSPNSSTDVSGMQPPAAGEVEAPSRSVTFVDAASPITTKGDVGPFSSNETPSRPLDSSADNLRGVMGGATPTIDAASSLNSNQQPKQAATTTEAPKSATPSAFGGGFGTTLGSTSSLFGGVAPTKHTASGFSSNLSKPASPVAATVSSPVVQSKPVGGFGFGKPPSPQPQAGSAPFGFGFGVGGFGAKSPTQPAPAKTSSGFGSSAPASASAASAPAAAAGGFGFGSKKPEVTQSPGKSTTPKKPEAEEDEGDAEEEVSEFAEGW